MKCYKTFFYRFVDIAIVNSYILFKLSAVCTTCTLVSFGQTATAQRRGCALCKDRGKKVKTPVHCSKCDVALEQENKQLSKTRQL